MYFVIFFALIICMLACHLLAKKKGYQPVAWGLSGALLGPLAVLVIALLPSRHN